MKHIKKIYVLDLIFYKLKLKCPTSSKISRKW